MLPLPPRQAETRLCDVHRLPPLQAEVQLRGVQSGTRVPAEFNADQARAGDFARDQARTLHHSRLFQLRQVKRLRTQVKVIIYITYTYTINSTIHIHTHTKTKSISTHPCAFFRSRSHTSAILNRNLARPSSPSASAFAAFPVKIANKASSISFERAI